ncbi:hypothetical protein BDN67DRAFT_984738 [Paxillus ammoniavirescens]|nr:hypothetical protein BDN67DRAFT_984738 [Paxillus ammoniavirescens]
MLATGRSMQLNVNRLPSPHQLVQSLDLHNTPHVTQLNVTTESEEGDRRINTPDIKYFFQQNTNGWICKKCVRRARNHPGLGIDIHTYGMETSAGMPDQMKLGKKEAKARDEAACWVTKAQQQTLMRPKFSEETFKAALVSFIVADDQSLNVIGCRKFRELLLLL